MEAMESGTPVPARSKSVLTPADSMARRQARNSRVHFDEDGYIPQLQEANPIQIQVTGEERSKTIGMYLGFLQEEHKYEVKFGLPHEMCDGYLIPPPPPASLQGQEKVQIEVSCVPSKSANGKSPEKEEESPKSKNHSYEGVELFDKGDLCEVTRMEWSGSGVKPAGLQVLMRVTVPSINVQHVFDDKFCIRSTSVPDRFVRIHVSAKIMGRTIGTPTLKDGIKCIGVCPDPRDSESESDSSSENEVDMKDVPTLSS